MKQHTSTPKPVHKPVPCTFDLVRFAYVLQARLDELDLSYRQISRLTGCSLRIISHALNGKPVNAGATYMLAALAQINLDDMLPTETREMLHRIRKLQQNQAVMAHDTHETIPQSGSVGGPQAIRVDA